MTRPTRSRAFRHRRRQVELPVRCWSELLGRSFSFQKFDKLRVAFRGCDSQRREAGLHERPPLEIGRNAGEAARRATTPVGA